MKNVLLSAALVLASAPAFAGSSADIARNHFAADNMGIESVVFTGSTQGLSAEAAAIFTALAAEDNGDGRHVFEANDGMTRSTQGGVNPAAAAIFAQLAAAEDGPDK
ncbi:hypothetical protein [Cochlodiniinecator piscidefendens]|uniref:hypothetical protein n=1 Tax=Cochlodiniinecator piscidefendens TaxID=2715756 RepID=UPI00140D1BAA|nr:hypothetical protein [Cochlodiniinecator piscidefendens]